MPRSSLVVAVAGGAIACISVLLAVSTYLTNSRGPRVSPGPLDPPSYRELALGIVPVQRVLYAGHGEVFGPGGGGRPPVGGGCGKFTLTFLEFQPTLLLPSGQVSLGSSTLVGLRVNLKAASAVRQACIVEQTSLSTSFRTDPTEKAVSIQEFSASEREIAENSMVYASLHMAGVEQAPKEPQRVSQRAPVFWSVKPTAPGDMSGWIKVSADPEGTSSSNGSQSLSVSVVNAETSSRFQLESTPEALGLRYVLSIVGAVLGTLLGSLPAWLAWHEKRKAERRDSTKKIILPP